MYAAEGVLFHEDMLQLSEVLEVLEPVYHVQYHHSDSIRQCYVY